VPDIHRVLQDELKGGSGHRVLQDEQKGSSGQEYPTVLSDGCMTDLVLQDEQKGGSGQRSILQQ